MASKTMNEPLLTDREVAELLGVSRTTARRLRYSRALPTIRVGSLARVPRAAVIAYVPSWLRLVRTGS